MSYKVGYIRHNLLAINTPGAAPAQNKRKTNNRRDNMTESLDGMQSQVMTRNIATTRGFFLHDIIYSLT